MRIFSTRSSKPSAQTLPASGEKVPAVGRGIPASPAEQEQLVRELVEQRLEQLGLSAKEESLLDRVGQLEARLERAEALLQDAVPNASTGRSPRQRSTRSPTTPVQLHMEESSAAMKDVLFASPSRSPRDTHISLVTPRGSPAVVETFLKDGSRFRTLEPPEMQCTPRALVLGTPSPRISARSGGPVRMGCVMEAGPRADEDEPPCEESPRSRPLMGLRGVPEVPRLALQPSLAPNALRFKGPKWGAPLEVCGDDATSQAGSEHLEDSPQPAGSEARRNAPPWSREPDEGTVEDITAAWLWQVDLPEIDEGLGLEVYCKDDDRLVDRLVVTSVREGRVARWNSARPRQQLRVEIGDQIVGVGTCEGSARELLEQLGGERSRGARTLKCRRDVQNWYRLKATAMGYVEQPGNRPPGRMF
jgi:hypothetical protein